MARIPPAMTVDALLELRSRGDVKRWGAWLDAEGRPLREPLVAAARARGAELEDADDLDGRRLLRRCLDRESAARIRQNPIALDESFTCVHCGGAVPIGGRRPRDHCPSCLHGRHVDGAVPGDRASSCGGVLQPVRLEPGEGRLVLVFRCLGCGAERRNRVLDDVAVPDDPAALRALVRGG